MKRKVLNAEMKEIYETKISDARWIAYDIPGNIGWILYFVGLVLCFTNQNTNSMIGFGSTTFC